MDITLLKRHQYLFAFNRRHDLCPSPDRGSIGSPLTTAILIYSQIKHNISFECAITRGRVKKISDHDLVGKSSEVNTWVEWREGVSHVHEKKHTQNITVDPTLHFV